MSEFDNNESKDLNELFEGDKRVFVNAFLETAGYDEEALDHPEEFEASYFDTLEAGDWTMVEVYSEGGGEGGGEHVERVFKISNSTGESMFFRITGYYASYAGTEWNGDFEEVEPREVLVTQYFSK